MGLAKVWQNEVILAKDLYSTSARCDVILNRLRSELKVTAGLVLVLNKIYVF
jgi:hypothetical protein